MLEISKKTDYGMQLMLILADNYGKKSVSLRQMAKEKLLPYRFLGQIAIPLKEAGLIEAKEGTNGGYSLSKSPNKINMAQIIEALEGEISIAGCGICNHKNRCKSGDIWNTIEKVLVKEMKKKTLADLLI
jgi:Rrf2 family protein